MPQTKKINIKNRKYKQTLGPPNQNPYKKRRKTVFIFWSRYETRTLHILYTVFTNRAKLTKTKKDSYSFSIKVIFGLKKIKYHIAKLRECSIFFFFRNQVRSL